MMKYMKNWFTETIDQQNSCIMKKILSKILKKLVEIIICT